LGAITRGGTGSLTAVPVRERNASATLAGNGALLATGEGYKVAAAALAGTGSLVATGTVIPAPRLGQAAMGGVGTLAAAATRVRLGAATLTANVGWLLDGEVDSNALPLSPMERAINWAPITGGGNTEAAGGGF
jgi:hypothetical protein